MEEKYSPEQAKQQFWNLMSRKYPQIVTVSLVLVIIEVATWGTLNGTGFFGDNVPYIVFIGFVLGDGIALFICFVINLKKGLKSTVLYDEDGNHKCTRRNITTDSKLKFNIVFSIIMSILLIFFASWNLHNDYKKNTVRLREERTSETIKEYLEYSNKTANSINKSELINSIRESFTMLKYGYGVVSLQNVKDAEYSIIYKDTSDPSPSSEGTEDIALNEFIRSQITQACIKLDNISSKEELASPHLEDGQSIEEFVRENSGVSYIYSDHAWEVEGDEINQRAATYFKEQNYEKAIEEFQSYFFLIAEHLGEYYDVFTNEERYESHFKDNPTHEGYEIGRISLEGGVDEIFYSYSLCELAETSLAIGDCYYNLEDYYSASTYYNVAYELYSNHLGEDRTFFIDDIDHYLFYMLYLCNKQIGRNNFANSYILGEIKLLQTSYAKMSARYDETKSNKDLGEMVFLLLREIEASMLIDDMILAKNLVSEARPLIKRLDDETYTNWYNDLTKQIPWVN